MAENNLINTSGENTGANSNPANSSGTGIPSWLQKAQEANKVLDPQATPIAPTVAAAAEQSTAVKQMLTLKDHEEKVKLDDQGKVVLDNVIGSPEAEVQKKEEKQLEGLTFEGLEEKQPIVAAPVSAPATQSVVAPVNDVPAAAVAVAEMPAAEVKPAAEAEKSLPLKQDQTPHDAPAWLKKISEVPQEKSNETAKSEQVQTQLIKEIATKNEEKPAEVPAPVTESHVVTAQDKAKAEAKGDLLKDLTKGLVQAVESTKKEIEKGKTAGIEESTITLENFEMSKAAKKYAETGGAAAKTPEGKKKEQIAAEERQKLMEAEKIFQEGMATVRDLIAPSSMEVNYDNIRVEGMYARTFVVYSYPRYLDTNWLSPIVNFDATMDLAQFIYPIDSAKIMKILTKKVTQMQSAMNLNAEKGLVRDPALETAYEDAEQLRTEIQRGQEKFFQFAMYLTVYADDLKKIDRISKQLESILGSKLILTKKADLRMEHGFNSTSPLCLDELEIFRNMNTGPLSTTFPFSSSDLTSSEGILYGLNRHNDSLVIFDRFALPNANSVCFATSGAGKSYAVKLEILRYLMLGVDVIVIDPENEYEELAKVVGGSYLRVSLTSDRRINPFDLPAALKDEELQPGDLLRSNIITLHGLLKIMLGGLTPVEEGVVDKALNDVYALKGITMDMVDPSNLPVPTMEDLHALLSNMDGGLDVAQRLEKYTKGTYAGIFNKPTNIDMQSGLMVFSIRDLEDALRPIAMYIILNYIWNRVRSSLKKRLLIVDEAWTMMQHEDSAKFLFGLVKRARKYYLGITTITQDVEDFMKSPYGKPIVTNSSMQLLLKQSSASINLLQKVFNLTEGEKYMLLNSGVGQGLFFAGLKHVAIQIIASYTEDKIVTTNPEEILRGLESGQSSTTYE